MKRFVALLLAATLFVCAFAGCSFEVGSSHKAYTFSVETGDSIKVTLDTANNYDLSSSVPVIISSGGTELSHGIFITAEAYEQYVSGVDTDENATLLETDTKGGNEYVFWSYAGEAGTEYNYAIKIANSNTGFILANAVSEESARECFGRLTIAKV